MISGSILAPFWMSFWVILGTFSYVFGVYVLVSILVSFSNGFLNNSGDFVGDGTRLGKRNLIL